MHTAIVAIEMPDEEQKWLNFQNTTLEMVKRPSFQRLGENIWQIDFQASPGDFSQFVAAVVKHGLVYKILPFDAAPQWLPARLDAKAK